MKPGKPRQINYTPRHGQMTAAHAIRDFWDLAVELITNCDDSYHHAYLERSIAYDGGSILVEVEPHRGQTASIVRVSDRGYGFRDLIAKIERVGAKTSQTGDRGFMARGLKDCAALGHITIETIVDDRLNKAEITPAFEVVPYLPERKGGDRATPADRERLGIRRGNGTVVEVKVDSRVQIPRVETLRRDLPWHYALRDIAAEGGPSKLLLRYSDGDTEPLICIEPKAEVVYDREHEVPGYEAHRFRFKLMRASDPLDDPSDPRLRRSGLLVKGRRGLHGCTFLASELERDPGAAMYFGRIECDGIDVMAEEWDDRREDGEPHPASNPTFILDPNRRGGLAEDHPFVRALYQIPADALRTQLEEERARRETKRRDVEAKETTDRLKKLAREASRFMREKLEDLGSAAPGDVVDDKAFHRHGVGVSPVFTQIPVGATKVFVVKTDNEKLDLPSGTQLEVGFSKAAAGAVEVVGPPGSMEPDPLDGRRLRGSFVLRGLVETRRVQVSCKVDGLDPVFAELQVIPAEPVDHDIPNNFAFHRQTYTVRQGGRRTLVLRARFDTPVPVSPRFRLEDSSAAVAREHREFELVPGTTYYEATLVVEGRRPNGKTVVLAEADGRSARCELRVAEKDEEGVDLTFRIVEHDLGMNYRAVWDRREPNTLLITTQHDSTRRYLGSADRGYPGQNSEPFRVLLAELISDNVCRRIVEAHARSQPDTFDSDKVYLLHNRLMKEFTPIAHRIQLASPS
ncbi:MAG: hypothetical protein QOJ82_3990 [Solirubrobacteraceae bacterium]|jgi:hypothetical protein|nr:hypothetical protein [Solirubrobacteraceae bacterium]